MAVTDPQGNSFYIYADDQPANKYERKMAGYTRRAKKRFSDHVSDLTGEKRANEQRVKLREKTQQAVANNNNTRRVGYVTYYTNGNGSETKPQQTQAPSTVKNIQSRVVRYNPFTRPAHSSSIGNIYNNRQVVSAARR